MKKVTFTTFLLILLTSVSVFANNKSNDINCINTTKVNTLIDLSENINVINKTIIINDLKTDVTKTSYLVKYNLIKSTSRKSKMKNVKNFLKNPERKDSTIIAMC